MKLIKIIFIILISFSLPYKAISSNEFKNILKDGGKLIFIRHAYAPGGGDPDGFDILDCTSQRNLNMEGIEQSKRIGQLFIKNDIETDKVLSSEWCRCKDTAEHAFKNYETKSFLNSFFSQEFSHNKDKQIKELNEYIKNWNGKNNLILVTHYVVIFEIINIPVSSGEIVVTDKDFNILIRQNTKNN
ncbi:histidine phosphatase family protein [Candidatus Pelagibacter sp.]|jgi:phosphohistidine phosphatase SixA|nr:histidine phosphatase family protein [Candidatus Pelagibacter sp.]